MKYSLQQLMPKKLRQIKSMSSRQRWYELRSSLWVLPAIYIILAVLLAIGAYYVEFGLEPAFAMAPILSTGYSLTQTMYSTLLSGVLTLNAFTFNSILVVLTSFSGQFTPRVLFNFISDRRTQHSIGIFNLCFFFLLIGFFFLNSSMEQYTVFPVLGVLATAVSVINFILFINHATKWMQVPSITTNMKEESQQRILNTLLYDLEAHRAKDKSEVREPETEGEPNVVASETTGFIQVIDFGKIVKEAAKDGIVVRLDRRIGDFVLEGIPIFSYWKTNEEPDLPVNEKKYRNFMYLGKSKTEVQDIEFGIRKLTEIAIKALGNDEPMTAQDAIYQLTDLVFSISKVTRFTSYLTDDNDTLRLIMKDEQFSYYVYSAFTYIASYAEEKPGVTLTLLEALVILSKALETKDKNCCWHYGKSIARNYAGKLPQDYDQVTFMNHLEHLSGSVNDKDKFYEMLDDFVEKDLLEKKLVDRRKQEKG
ncbi:DUF2254 domain-containing protein [Marinococcus halotolerans]|uniref:DUF2254 domain-containing protein n=1 Tax=Marinococcus halotolerans TaxID=301092 RepID=UPI0003B67ED5|nr:DUF2254 domain-containing protein [Marinococcus halotolerans]